MADYTLTTEQSLGDEIARVRHGQDVTASDLANRLMPWLSAHDAEVRAAALAEQGEEWQYGVQVWEEVESRWADTVWTSIENAEADFPEMKFRRVRRAKSAPWLPVSTEEEKGDG